MQKKERYQKVLSYFRTNHPVAETELRYSNTYELLVAVILSAQCTDKRINMVTPALFQRFPSPDSLAKASVEEVFEYIKSVSYPNNKAKHLVGMAQMLLQDFNGIVPDSVQELIKLPGVGRKTANVIVSVVYQQPAMAVDTHVFRVSARLGLTTGAKTPLQAEQQLMQHIPTHEVHIAHHWLILHGRYICTARSPKCNKCPFTEFCKYFKAQQRKLLKP